MLANAKIAQHPAENDIAGMKFWADESKKEALKGKSSEDAKNIEAAFKIIYRLAREANLTKDELKSLVEAIN